MRDLKDGSDRGDGADMSYDEEMAMVGECPSNRQRVTNPGTVGHENNNVVYICNGVNE